MPISLSTFSCAFMIPFLLYSFYNMNSYNTSYHDLIRQRMRQIRNTEDVLYRMLRIIESQEQSLSELISEYHPHAPYTNTTYTNQTRRQTQNRPYTTRNSPLSSPLSNPLNNIFNQLLTPNRQAILSAFYIPLNDILATTTPRGLTQTEIDNNTTTIRYRDIIQPINTECPISQETFELNEQVLQIIRCRHIFQRESLLQWFRSGTGCPLCRVPLNQPPTQNTPNPTPTPNDVDIEVTFDLNESPNLEHIPPSESSIENTIRNAIRNASNNQNRTLGQITPDNLVNSIFDIINNYN